MLKQRDTCKVILACNGFKNVFIKTVYSYLISTYQNNFYEELNAHFRNIAPIRDCHIQPNVATLLRHTVRSN